jgi:hypothetical protein
MPSSAISKLMNEVAELHTAVASIKTDIEALKKIVYLCVGIGLTTAGGIIVQIAAHTIK